jgi:hypothetical protein
MVGVNKPRVAQPTAGLVSRTARETPQAPSFGIQCAEDVCEPEAEVCCWSRPALSGVAPSQRCEPASRETERCLPGVLACDDSQDCPARRFCCVDGEPTSYRCEQHSCGSFEVCTPQSKCRTPGTSCVDGYCRGKRPAVAIPCGAETCTDAQSVCCVSADQGKRYCASSCESPFEYGIECTSAADCPVNEICLIAPLGHRSCGRLSHNLGVACAGDAECPSLDGRRPFTCQNGECLPIEVE